MDVFGYNSKAVVQHWQRPVLPKCLLLWILMEFLSAHIPVLPADLLLKAAWSFLCHTVELLHAFFCSPAHVSVLIMSWKFAYSHIKCLIRTICDLFQRAKMKTLKWWQKSTCLSPLKLSKCWMLTHRLVTLRSLCVDSAPWLYLQTWWVMIVIICAPHRRQWWTVPCGPSPISQTLAALWFWWHGGACLRPHQRISQNLPTLPAKGRVSTGWSATSLSQRMWVSHLKG